MNEDSVMIVMVANILKRVNYSNYNQRCFIIRVTVHSNNIGELLRNGNKIILLADGHGFSSRSEQKISMPLI